MFGGDAWRRQLVISVLFQLVALFAKPPIEARTSSTGLSKAAHFLQHITENNLDAFKRVSASIVSTVLKPHLHTPFRPMPVFIPL